MTKSVGLALGLSIGATRMAAVVPGRLAATRHSILTRYPHRPAQVGGPQENPNPGQPGLIITGFVERVADPIGIVAADGSVHRGEAVVADALSAMAGTVSHDQPDSMAVAFPAHWGAPAIGALQRALAGNSLPQLVSDADAALTTLQSGPWLPTRGVIALCDFGGTGTTVTLADAADGYRLIGPATRYPDFSGELIDALLLNHVIAELGGVAGSLDVTGTSAIGALSQLRTQCRGAKERLSDSAVSTLYAELPGFTGDVRLTRSELDNAVGVALRAFVEMLRETLYRSGIHPADLTAVATVGGGARIPAITTALSEQFRVPVIMARWPELAAAEGAALLAARGPVDETSTAVAPSAPQSGTLRALAWSEADDIPESMTAEPVVCHYEAPDPVGARPQLEFEPGDDARPGAGEKPRWYSHPVAVAAVTIAAILLTGVAVAVAHRNDDASASTKATTSALSTAPDAIAAAPPVSADPGQPEQATSPQPVRVPADYPRAVAPPADAQVGPAAPPADPPQPTNAPPTTTDTPSTTTETPTTTNTPTPTNTPTTTTAAPTTTATPTTTASTPPPPPTTTPPPSTTAPPTSHEPPPSATSTPPHATTTVPAQGAGSTQTRQPPKPEALLP